MSESGTETVIPMPPVSTVALEAIGNEMLAILQPENLQYPRPLDVVRLVDFELQKHGIFVVPASYAELPAEEGQTDPIADDAATYIKIREDFWERLFLGGPSAHRARATVAHEIAHAVIHAPTIRRRLKSPNREVLLNRVQSNRIEVFRNPEWQAWTLGGCFMAPRVAIDMMPRATVKELAAQFEMSEGFMRLHLRRLKIHRP